MSRPRLPGANPVTRKRADGSVALQWYASRYPGAQLIAEFKGATLEEALEAERDGAAELAGKYAEAREVCRRREVKDFAGLLLAYAAAPEFTRLADSTQAEWNRVLKALRTSPLAKLSLRALQSKGARAAILDYRDSLAATPRKADYHVQVINRVLNWGVDREHIVRNPAAGIAAIYDSDRAEVIVEPEELEALKPFLTVQAWRAVRLVRLSGLRRGDAVKAAWTGLQRDRGTLTVYTGKGRRKKAAQVVELTPELLALIDECPKVASTILTKENGQPYSAEGLSTAFRRARTKAKWEKAADGTNKRFHDMRGTTATEKVAKALADPKFQQSMGWSGRAAKTAGRYVDAGNVVAQMAAPEAAPRVAGKPKRTDS